MEVINSTDLHKTPGKYSIRLLENKMAFVANERIWKHSFLCVEPRFMSKVLREAGRKGDSDMVIELLNGVKQRISERFTEISARRNK